MLKFVNFQHDNLATMKVTAGVSHRLE